VLQELTAGEFTDAKNAMSAAQSETFKQSEGTPDLDAVGDERVAKFGAKALSEPGGGELADVAADDVVSAPAVTKRGAEKVEFAAVAGFPIFEAAVAVAAEVAGVEGGVVESEQIDATERLGEFTERFQVEAKDARDASFGHEELGGEKEQIFHRAKGRAGAKGEKREEEWGTRRERESEER